MSVEAAPAWSGRWTQGLSYGGLGLNTYFNGNITAHGVFTDRAGKVKWRFTVATKGEVQFDDWMYLMDERVLLNKAVMSKFGVRLGEVTLAFCKN